MSTRIELPRTGTAEAPLVIIGTVRAETFTPHDEKSDRWYDLAGYAVTGVGFTGSVYAVGFRTTRNHESNLDWTFAGDKDLSEWARSHEIAAYLTGFPGGEQFEPRRQATARGLRVQLMRAVSELLTMMRQADHE